MNALTFEQLIFRDNFIQETDSKLRGKFEEIISRALQLYCNLPFFINYRSAQKKVLAIHHAAAEMDFILDFNLMR